MNENLIKENNDLQIKLLEMEKEIKAIKKQMKANIKDRHD
jgi:hypothetical protein